MSQGDPFRDDKLNPGKRGRPKGKLPLAVTLVPAIFLLVLIGTVGVIVAYQMFLVEVPAKHVAILVKRDGKDLTNDMELAPTDEYKGVQLKELREGRHFRNPLNWDWEIKEQVEVESNEIAVVVRLFGDPLPHGEIIAWEDNQKGILPQVLNAGRYPEFSNHYAYQVVKFPINNIPSGYRGVVTQLSGKDPVKPNEFTVQAGERGVQTVSFEPRDIRLNPYLQRVNLVETEYRTVVLAENGDIGFPSADGFWIRLDGTVRYRILPEHAADVYVKYNEGNVSDINDDIHDEVINKVIMPYARSFCRLAGSTYTSREIIQGETREQFQTLFETRMKDVCAKEGIEVAAARISNIGAPRVISEQLEIRKIAELKQDEFRQQIILQKSEADKIISTAMAERKRRLIEAEQQVIEMTTQAQQQQAVALTDAEKRFAVSQKMLEATQDKAATIIATGTAEAQVIELSNKAQASGLQASVAAFNGDGFLYAQQVLFERLAPRYESIIANSANSPLMEIFTQYQARPVPAKTPTPPLAAKPRDAQTPPAGTETAAAANQNNENGETK